LDWKFIYGVKIGRGNPISKTIIIPKILYFTMDVCNPELSGAWILKFMMMAESQVGRLE
jgi:hypothetical protein